jgi:hypothetical protein
MARGGGEHGVDESRGLLADPTAASDIVTSFGVHGNAEDLIRAHNLRRNPALARVQMSQIDAEATKKLLDGENEDGNGLDELTEQLRGDNAIESYETVLEAVVRGNAITGVVDDGRGNWRKFGPVGANDRYKPPVLTAEQEADRARAEADRQVAEETRRLRAEAERKIAKARVEAEAEVSEALAKIREDAEARVQEAADDAAEAEAERENADDPKSGEKPRSGKAGSGQQGSTRSPSEKAGETSERAAQS